MAWAPVQSTIQRVASGANAKAYGSAVTGGSLLLIAIGLETDTATISNVISSTGDTCVAIGALQSQSGNGAGQVYYVKNATAAATTITVTPSAGGSHIIILEYSGLDTANPLDTHIEGIGTGTSASSGTATLAVTGELVFGFNLCNRAITAGAGFNERQNGTFNIFVEAEDEVAPTTSEAVTATVGGSPTQTWIAFLAAFREPFTPSARKSLLLMGVG